MPGGAEGSCILDRGEGSHCDQSIVKTNTVVHTENKVQNFLMMQTDEFPDENPFFKFVLFLDDDGMHHRNTQRNIR